MATRKERESRTGARDPRVTELHVRRLQEGMAQIPRLREIPEKAHASEFSGWERRMNQGLETVFGRDHDYTRRFGMLRFWSTRFALGGGRVWTQRDQEIFDADLHSAEGILYDALEEAEVAPPPADVPIPGVPDRPSGSVIINLNNILSQATNVSTSQVLATIDSLGLTKGDRDVAAAHAKDLEAEIRGEQRWPVLAKSLAALKALGKGVYERVALPLILDMMKKQAGL